MKLLLKMLPRCFLHRGRKMSPFMLFNQLTYSTLLKEKMKQYSVHSATKLNEALKITFRNVDINLTPSTLTNQALHLFWSSLQQLFLTFEVNGQRKRCMMSVASLGIMRITMVFLISLPNWFSYADRSQRENNTRWVNGFLCRWRNTKLSPSTKTKLWRRLGK